MSFLRRLSFQIWYTRRPPWDSGIVPPEVEELIRTQPPGRALDLGCGSGTSSLALAEAGWAVSGVDFVPAAIRTARHKAQRAGLTIDFQVGDVSRLRGVRGTFELVLDIGCFHGLTDPQKARYLGALDGLLTPGGTWLIYGFFAPGETPGPVPPGLSLVRRQDGFDRRERPSAWLWFCKTHPPKVRVP